MKAKKKYCGVVVPIVSAFTQAGEIDEPATAKITEHLVSAGTCPLILGTTGEGPSISEKQRSQLVRAVVNQAKGRGTVYACIGDQCLSHSVEAAKKYFDLGVDAVISQLPSYYPLSPDEMLRYYETLVEAVPGPLVLYNIPITTHLSIPLQVIDRLSHHPKIVGVKDSEGDESRFRQAINLWKNREDFSHFTGSETFAVMALLLGSDGVVPSTGNIIPAMYRQLYDAASSGDAQTATDLWEKAQEIGQTYLQYKTLNQTLPALKTIMHLLGFCEDVMLSPLHACTPEEKMAIREQLVNNRVLS